MRPGEKFNCLLTEANEADSKAIHHFRKNIPLSVTTMAPPSNKNPLPPPFAPTRLATRAKNKDARPGAVKPRRTPTEMQAIRNQQALDKQNKKEKQEQALENAADIEDEQHEEGLERAAISKAHKPQVASFRPPPATRSNLAESDIETKKRTVLEMHISYYWLSNKGQANRGNSISSDAIESDNRDRYRPDSADAMPESSDSEIESEEEADADHSKKGKRFKPGRRDIAAARQTVPTTGSKSASAHSKRQRSPRQVTWVHCYGCLIYVESKAFLLGLFPPRKPRSRTSYLPAFVLAGILISKLHPPLSHKPSKRVMKTTIQ
jgi:hypothetical protein